MTKEILLYGSIYSESSSLFIAALNDNIENDITIRVACNGGEPEYGFGMVAKFAEHPKNKNIKVDGKAYSFGLYFLCYADYSECLDVSEFLIHRAAYPSWIEKNPDYFTEAMRGNLDRINTSLRKAFENKIDVVVFEELKGVKVKDIFSMESRLDVFLSAKEAKQIGLVNKINKITPEKKAEIESKMVTVNAQFNPFPISVEKIKPELKLNNTIMTIEKIKSEHPAVYAEILALGVSQEKDRVEAALVFIDVDPAGVKTAIESGKPLSQKQMADFAMKSFNKETLKNLEVESPKEVVTPELTNKTAAQKSKEDFENELKAELNIGK